MVGYNYPKNLDKQEIAKLVVPRLVANLGCYAMSLPAIISTTSM